MKKFTRVMIVMTLGVFIASGASAASIKNSKHDLSSGSSAAIKFTTENEICVACHTPHHANQQPGAPLWNRDATAATFQVYTSPTLTATDLTQPAGTSKLCLSCHDGTVALNAYRGSNAGDTVAIGAGGLLGTDLRITHPVSFTYDAALVTADGGLNATSTATLGGTIATKLLFSGKVECASCHDVHDPANAPFLVMNNEGSALCLTCHNK